METPYKIPFDEVTFSLAGKDLSISSPWASIEAEIEGDSLISDDLISPINYQNNNMQTLLEHLQEYCLSYDIPRSTLLNEIHFSGPEALPCNLQDLSKCRTSQGLYDPVTVFQFLQKDALVQHSNTQNIVYEALEESLAKSADDFKKSLIFLLNQTYYITENFSKVVHPNQKMARGLFDFAQAIYQEEVGHHKLLLQSLNALGVDPDFSQVNLATKELINIVSESFQQSALGFALINSALEGSHYPVEDPLSRVIKQSPFKEAAIGIDKHFKINKEGNHKDTGLKIAASMSHYVGQKEVSYVLNLSKRFQQVLVNIDQNLIDFIKKEKKSD